jgi:hypothetical protein
VPNAFTEAAHAYDDAGTELYGLDAVAARAWMHLEHCDAVLAAVQGHPAGPDDPVFAVKLAALATVERALARLQSVVAQHQKGEAATEGLLPAAEVAAMLGQFAEWVDEVAHDPTVPRDEIRWRLVDRVAAFVGSTARARSCLPASPPVVGVRPVNRRTPDPRSPPSGR